MSEKQPDSSTPKSFSPEALVREIRQDRGPAPVHLWDPPFCGDIDMRIGSDGSWYYQGSPLRRAAMVRLFSSVLRLDDDGCHYLVTPVEKLRIQVDDCPFVATLLDHSGADSEQSLVFTLNTGETVTADSDHRIHVDESDDGEPHPVLHVRDGLNALISRNVFYTLVELASESQDGEEEPLPGVWSGGEFFPLGRA